MSLKWIIKKRAAGCEPELRKEIAERVTKERKAKADKQLARQAIYLSAIAEEKLLREQAYENRKQIKVGLRESCKQRKRRLRKEYLASKTSSVK